VRSFCLDRPGAAVVEDRILEKRIVKNFDHSSVAADSCHAQGFPDSPPGNQLHVFEIRSEARQVGRPNGSIVSVGSATFGSLVLAGLLLLLDDCFIEALRTIQR